MIQPSSCEAIVVGAGPAGAATALLLARAGRDVLLLDREIFPRAKPCGDCLSAGAARVLDRLGLLAAVERERPARLEGWRIVAPGGATLTGRFGRAARGDARVRSALALSRDRLDRVLVDGARRNGAMVRTGVQATDLLRDDEGAVVGVEGRGPDGAPLRLRARLVVGADGLRSVIARRLGLVRRPPKLRKLSLTAHVAGVRGLDAFGEMHVGDGVSAGLAPVEQADGGSIANLTLVVDSGRFGAAVGRDREAFFWHALERFPRLDGRLDDAEFAGVGTDPDTPAPSGPLLSSGPFDWPMRSVVADGAALVGDAAGYYDPFTGQGIYQALAGAELLAREADAALRAGDLSRDRLQGYDRARASRARGVRILQHTIEHVLSRPRLADAAIGRLARSRRAGDALVAAAGDLRPALSLLSPFLLLNVVFDSFVREVVR